MLRPAKVLAALFSIGIALSCVEAPTAPPTPPIANESLLEVPPDMARVLRRTARLESNEVVSQVVGPAGGTLVLPRAGFTLAIPPGALAQATQITVTAEAGHWVGYRFAPHGLQFSQPLVASQNILGTEVGLGTVLATRAAYFQGPIAEVVRALERLDLQVLPNLGVLRFQIQHFSGYVYATD